MQDAQDTIAILKKTYRLLPHERLISITAYPVRTFAPNPSSVEQILRLTRSSHIDEIGRAGPALASLAMLDSEVEEPLDHQEHLHLYEAVFGRDSLRVAIDLIETYPELTRSTIMTLAQLQGTTFDAFREEEPGRIVHEVRDPEDPMARKLTAERGWQWPYYGTVDATPEFIRTLAAYTRSYPENHTFLNELYNDRTGQEHTILDALDKALGWIAQRRAENSEGLIEFKSTLPNGIENQVWKDSWDAYHHADGTIANHKKGIASLEVQISAYDALHDAADLYDRFIDNETRAASLRAQANELYDAIYEHFWTEDKGGYFVLGTDRDDQGNLRQMKIRTSNMGHTLSSRLLEGNDPEVIRKRKAVAAQILSPELWCKAGIRTLASDEVRFRPGAYQNGSVWLWDTHHIAQGLRRHGYQDEANQIDNHLIDIVNTTGLFPEYVRGEQDDFRLNQLEIILWDEDANRQNIVEQAPQEVQAWTVAAIRDSKRQAWERSELSNAK